MEDGVGQQELDLAVVELLVCTLAGCDLLHLHDLEWVGLGMVPRAQEGRFQLWLSHSAARCESSSPAAAISLSTVDHFPWGPHLPQLRHKVPEAGLGNIVLRHIHFHVPAIEKRPAESERQAGVALPSCTLELCLRPSWRSVRAPCHPWKDLARFWVFICKTVVLHFLVSTSFHNLWVMKAS